MNVKGKPDWKQMAESTTFEDKKWLGFRPCFGWCQEPKIIELLDWYGQE